MALCVWPGADIGAQDGQAGNGSSRIHLSDEGENGHLSEPELDELLTLADGSLESLLHQDVLVPALDEAVTTVARTESTVGRSPTAVFVVTNEMIRRSGVRTIPDALRLVPGVQVARIDANKWAVSIRGFNGRFANKLLVQIDGRTVYTPLFAGVYWDVQDVVLEDVDRIEVIRGPGASMWGANAVNGVVNIITKSAAETQGVLYQGGAGSEDRGFSTLRVGGRIGDRGHYRIYGQWFDRDSSFDPVRDAADDWRQARGGFRVDLEPTCCDTVTVQGEYYTGSSGHGNWLATSTPPDFAAFVPEDALVSGGHVLSRWQRTLDDASDWAIQIYYDRTQRLMTLEGFGETRDTVDIDLQYRFPIGDYHHIITGLGYRNTTDQLHSEPLYLELFPRRRTDDVISYFIQDEMTLWEDLWYLTVGSKFEHNDYTGFEYQPTARLLYTPTSRLSAWASVSRAVRTPSRAEDDVVITGPPISVLPPPPVPMPVFQRVLGDRSLKAEDLMAYEAGIRGQPDDRFYWDFAAFYNNYRHLVGISPVGTFGGVTPDGWPAVFATGVGTNSISGESYGFELAATYQWNDVWQTRAGYTFLRILLDAPSSAQPLLPQGANPRNQVYAAVSATLPEGLQLDVIGRYVDQLPDPHVPAYVVMDVRVAWRCNSEWELFLVGRNLLDAEHQEFASDTLAGGLATQVPQSVYGGITWQR